MGTKEPVTYYVGIWSCVLNNLSSPSRWEASRELGSLPPGPELRPGYCFFCKLEDPFLSDVLMALLVGIFTWTYEALKLPCLSCLHSP